MPVRTVMGFNKCRYLIFFDLLEVPIYGPKLFFADFESLNVNCHAHLKAPHYPTLRCLSHLTIQICLRDAVCAHMHETW